MQDHISAGIMEEMNYRHIIAEAWEFTKDNKRLMWWYAFAPAVVTTLVGVLYVVYQFFAFKRSPLFDNAEHSFLTDVISTTVNFFSAHGEMVIPSIIVMVIVLICYALLPTLCQGALIQIIARSRDGNHVPASHGISYGLIAFLPLLEYHLAIKTFSIFSILTEAGFVLRNLGPGAIAALLPILIVALVIGFLLSLVFTYSEYFIVLKRKPVLASMGRSTKLVVLSWQHTFLIGILMLIIGVRILINIAAVLFVPAILFFTAGFVATTTLTTLGITIGIIVSAIGLFIASYFTGILNVFANTVWTFTFLSLIEQPHVKEVMNE